MVIIALNIASRIAFIKDVKRTLVRFIAVELVHFILTWTPN